jgi:hypothetical protein
LQAGGRRFDPVWLHQTAPPAPKFVRENINPRVVRSAGARVMSDIVKRRSIRALRVAKVTGCALSPSGIGKLASGFRRNPDDRYLMTETWNVGEAWPHCRRVDLMKQAGLSRSSRSDDGCQMSDVGISDLWYLNSVIRDGHR